MFHRFMAIRNVVLAFLVGAHVFLLFWSSWRNSATIDEVPYLVAGVSHWQLGQFDLCRVNPPLVRFVAAMPVVLCGPTTDWTVYPTQEPSPTYRVDFPAGQHFINANRHTFFWLCTLGRWACVVFGVIGACVCYCWARDLFGWPSGMLAAAMWCFCPNVIAHGQLLTPDVGGCAMGLLAAYCFWRWLKSTRPSEAVLAGVALGLAQLSRTTWVVLFALWPITWLAWSCVPWKRAPFRRKLGGLGQLLLSLLVGLFVLNAGYGFDGTFVPLARYSFTSTALGGPNAKPSAPANRFREGAFGALRVPLPKDYLQGIDMQRGDFEMKWPSYLRGRWQDGGWWYYYAYAFLVKIPLGSWVLVLLAAGCVLCASEFRVSWRSELTLLLPAAVVFVLVSSQTGFSHHMRYALGVIPFGFIWVSRVARSMAVGNKAISLVWIFALTWSVSSSLWIFPHSIAYFNESVGGPFNGRFHLIDSNLDWGQDLLFFRTWLLAHPEAVPLRMAYFPTDVDPRVAGIDYEWPPIDPRSKYFYGQQQKAFELPGWYAVSVNEIHAREGQYAYIRECEPVAYAGYSIYVYHLSQADSDRIRQKIGW